MNKLTVDHCDLCNSVGGDLLWHDETCRIVAVTDPDFPGFCRVILQSHMSEMTDLEISLRNRLLEAVFAVESALRELMRPDKINLASLGNLVPHLHWHVIPRFRDDSRFPDPVWAAPRRADSPLRHGPERSLLVDRLKRALG